MHINYHWCTLFDFCHCHLRRVDASSRTVGERKDNPIDPLITNFTIIYFQYISGNVFVFKKTCVYLVLSTACKCRMSLTCIFTEAHVMETYERSSFCLSDVPLSSYVHGSVSDKGSGKLSVSILRGALANSYRHGVYYQNSLINCPLLAVFIICEENSYPGKSFLCYITLFQKMLSLKCGLGFAHSSSIIGNLQ